MKDHKFVSDRFNRDSEYDTLVASYGGLMVRLRVLPNGDAVREKVVSNDAVRDSEKLLEDIYGVLLSHEVERIYHSNGDTIAEA